MGAAERSGVMATDRQRVARAVVFAGADADRNTDTDINTDGYSGPDADRHADADARTFGRLHGTGMEPDRGVHRWADRVA